MPGIADGATPAAVAGALEDQPARKQEHGLLRALGAWDVSLITIGTTVRPVEYRRADFRDSNTFWPNLMRHAARRS